MEGAGQGGFKKWRLRGPSILPSPPEYRDGQSYKDDFRFIVYIVGASFRLLDHAGFA